MMLFFLCALMCCFHNVLIVYVDCVYIVHWFLCFFEDFMILFLDCLDCFLFELFVTRVEASRNDGTWMDKWR